MNPQHYHGMTDAQLQEWHQLSSRVERLNEMLLQEQNKNTALSAQLADLHYEKRIMEEGFREDFDRHAAEIREATERWMLARNELAALTEHLPPILADWLAPFEAFSDAGLEPEFVKRRQTVRHLLGLLGLYSI